MSTAGEPPDPEREAFIARIIAPFAHDPKDNGMPQHLWRERRTFLAALTQLEGLASEARSKLHWFYLNKNSTERAAIPALRELHARMRSLLTDPSAPPCPPVGGHPSIPA